jgi:hypothetical protein
MEYIDEYDIVQKGLLMLCFNWLSNHYLRQKRKGMHEFVLFHSFEKNKEHILSFL